MGHRHRAHAALGLLAAERVRTRTGVGQFVSVSLADVAFTMVADLGYLAQAQVLGEARPPIGNDMYGAFGRDFPTADDRRVMVVAISLRQWQSLVDAVGIGEHLPAIERAFQVDLTQEGDRFRARDALAALIAPWVAERTLPAIAEMFDRHGVCWGAYQTFAQLLDEDWRVSADANPVFRDIDQPGIGKVRVGGSPLAFGAIDRDDPRPAPTLGEHTEQILAEELGCRRRDRRAARRRHRGRPGLSRRRRSPMPTSVPAVTGRRPLTVPVELVTAGSDQSRSGGDRMSLDLTLADMNVPAHRRP